MNVRKTLEKNLPFPDTFYKNLVELLYKPLLLGENSVLLCPPMFGKEYIVKYLSERVEDKKRILGNKFSHYYFTHPIQIGPYDNEYETYWLQQFLLALPHSPLRDHSFANLEKHLRSILDEDGLDIVFVTNILESLDQEFLTKFLQLAKRIYFIAPSKVHFILFLDHKWNDLEFTQIISPYYSLFQHIIRPPERTDSEIAHFTQYRLSVWNHSIDKDALDLIVHEAGGIPLFAKAAVRIATKNSASSVDEVKNIILADPEYRHRIQIFWDTLTKLQRNILTDIANGKSPLDPEVEHLVNMNVINKQDDLYTIRSTTLERFINPANKNIFNTLAKHTKFTPTESEILKTLCETPGEVISRDRLSQIIWKGDADSYSDWAIDQTISRLRRKLEKIPNMKIELIAKKKSGVYIHL